MDSTASAESYLVKLIVIPVNALSICVLLKSNNEMSHSTSKFLVTLALSPNDLTLLSLLKTVFESNENLSSLS